MRQHCCEIHSSEHQPWVITEGTAICTAAPVTLGEAENIDAHRTETETRRRVNVSVVKNLGLITKGNMLPQCLSLCSVIANHWGMNVWCLCSAYFKLSDSLDPAIGPCHVPLGLICVCDFPQVTEAYIITRCWSKDQCQSEREWTYRSCSTGFVYSHNPSIFHLVSEKTFPLATTVYLISPKSLAL
jgi:hypothetical protein